MKISKSQVNCPFGPELENYWAIRYELFSRFDEGIEIDKEGLYSVKPEAIALDIGKTIEGETVLDAFCGVGGSAIGIARAGKRVITVDLNKDRLMMAEHNAKIYGVFDQITFVQGHALDVIAEQEYDAVYLDPPWGGPDYINKKWFTFNAFSPNGSVLLEAVFQKVERVAITLPLNFDLRELIPLKKNFYLQWAFVGSEWTRLGGSPIFSTAYFGQPLTPKLEFRPHKFNLL